MEIDDSFEETAQKELYEETGLMAQEFKLIDLLQEKISTINFHMVMKYIMHRLFLKLLVLQESSKEMKKVKN